ncbi:two-component regulator propeller domain-containing protein [Mucilaginibacter sp. CSA2-8R]|uniref:ligand-binding sensor domain-containing protein n=1 Tax=Mucilaginibacter sp. CSA2-8R TaxID=3141542 RepID=UPI00315C7E43
MFNIKIFCTLLLSLIAYHQGHGQNQSGNLSSYIFPFTALQPDTQGPNTIVRGMINDRKGHIWIATFRGVFRYDGKSFTNMTEGVSSARFFSVLQDRNGNFWFGSIGSGVYFYDGKTFRKFTIKDGLLNNEVTSIYEDKAGNIWFGVSGGVSRYDGTSFRNFIINGDAMNEDRSGKTFANRQRYEVNAIMEDRAGRFWLATRGNTFVYDGKAFTVVSQSGKPFKNVRSLLQDSGGRIWLGGNDGLWRYQDGTWTSFTTTFTCAIYEDQSGNLWTGSGNDFTRQWALSRYDKRLLTRRRAPTPKIMATDKIVFSILQAPDGSIWFGTFNGVQQFNKRGGC